MQVIHKPCMAVILCHILFKNGEYPYIAQQLMQKLNEARRKFPCPCQVLPDRQEPVSKSMGLDYLCFLYQALMLTALFIIADTNQQYLPRIRLNSLRIVVFVSYNVPC